MKCGLCGCDRTITLTSKVRVEKNKKEFIEKSYSRLCFPCLLRVNDILLLPLNDFKLNKEIAYKTNN